MKLVDKMIGPAVVEDAWSAPAHAGEAPRVLIRPEGRSVMSSAQRRRKPWVLRGEPSMRPPVDPLMGWCGDADTHSQVELRFSTLEAAMAFARRRGWRFDVVGGGPAPAREAGQVMLDDGQSAGGGAALRAA